MRRLQGHGPADELISDLSRIETVLRHAGERAKASEGSNPAVLHLITRQRTRILIERSKSANSSSARAQTEKCRR